ncbi:MAG: PDZ domain-containing protein [Nitrososphaeraceae archaeon]|nr:PDZ domain-containing protein [Nitrososphaeraceae archaeon]
MPNYIWIVVIAILTTSMCFGIPLSEAIAQQSNDNSSNVVINNSLSASISASDPLTLPQIFNKTENSVVQITSTSPISNSLVIRNGEQIPQNGVALGSGFVYDQDGHILTNYHVISDPNSVEVTFVDGDSYSAKIIGQDPYSDIAVLRITDDGFQKQIPPLKAANSSALQVGEQVIAIGNPFGLSGTLTSGVISQMGRVLPNDITGYSISNIIQTDAAINPGNSGGPLLNTKGELVGVNTAIFSNTGVYSGVGFAIPSNMVQKVVSSLLKNGSYEHPYMGISGITVSPEISNATHLNDTKGILVVDITANSPADKAGIRGGDVLTAVDGQDIRLGGDVIVAVDNQSVRAMEDLLSYLEEQKAVGDNIELSVIRDGKTQHIDMVLTARPNQEAENMFQPNQDSKQQQQRPALGINGINMTPELAELMNLTQSQKGFLIEDIISGGPADKAEIRGGYKIANINGSEFKLGGDIVVGIDEADVSTIQDIQSYLDTKEVGDSVQIRVLRDGQEITVPLTLGNIQSEQAPLEQLPQLPFSQEEPFGGDPFGDMYERCVEGVGKEACDQLFGR